MTTWNIDDNDSFRMSHRRDDICEGVVSRLLTLFAEEKFDDALCLCQEYHEWMEETMLHKEQTIFYNEDELKELFHSLER